MFQPEVSFYLGEQKSDGYSGVVFQNNLFFCLEISSGISVEQGHQILDFVKEKIKKVKIVNISTLDRFIIDLIKEKNLPSGFSLAVGYLRDNVLYLKTTGDGKVFIKRKGKLGLLIEGNNTAFGSVEEDDFFIFLTDNFFQLIGARQGLEERLDYRSPNEIIEEITPILKAKNDFGAVSLFVKFHYFTLSEVEESEIVSLSQKNESKFLTRSKIMIEKLNLLWYTMKSSKKTLTFITVFILFLVFLWSVILGFKRRNNAIFNQKIKDAKELIYQKLSTAEEVAYLNINRAVVLINESKNEVNKLEKETGNNKKEINDLKKMIEEMEKKIFKKEQKGYSEFYDLAVDDKNVKGDKLYLVNDRLLINDKKRGVLYNLYLEKKSLDKNQFKELKSTFLIAGFGEEKFFYVKGSGIFMIDINGKLKKIIENDRDWGEIIDMSIYNGNLYLLDREKDEIWKYLKSEDGYGKKSSYFQSSQSIDLSNINSLAIDGSIYLVGDSMIFKYTSGLRDSFSVDLPDKNVNLTKVFTSKDLEKVYLWDKNHSLVYVLSKNGEYIEQINSEILSKGSDIVVYKDTIYVLFGSKIYKID